MGRAHQAGTGAESQSKKVELEKWPASVRPLIVKYGLAAVDAANRAVLGFPLLLITDISEARLVERRLKQYE